jgi:AcrR family transcriptional regulator
VLINRLSVCQANRVPPSSNRNIARGLATREHIVAVATRLFADRGYEGTSIELVLQTARISRGALYHHFDGKDALFEAVLEAIEADVGQRTVAAMRGATDAYSALRAGAEAWVRIAADPVVQRVLLIDAPAVLGWHRWRAMDERHALGGIRLALSEISKSGGLPTEFVDMFAHVVLAAMNEIAMVIATADDTEAAVRDGAAAVDDFLQRLLRPTAKRSSRVTRANWP